MTSRPVFRFAPSPNGELHLGHALSALTGFTMARRMGGRFLLRIEDIDLQRTREAHVQQILDDLTWLGVVWDEPVVRQSQRFDLYGAAARKLLSLGVLYRCWATRRDLEAAAGAHAIGTDPDGVPLYPGLCKGLSDDDIAARLASGEPWCLRIDMGHALRLAAERQPDAALSFVELDASGRARTVAAAPDRWGDAVIVRKDTPASYHLAVVVDDAAQGVTHVTRGQDLLAATDLHRLLQVLLDLPAPLYHHHALLMDAEGRKLSKSARDTSLRQLRAEGLSRETVLGMAGLDPGAFPHNS